MICKTIILIDNDYLFDYLVMLHAFCLLILFKNHLFKKKKKVFQEYHQSVNVCVGPDMGPNYFQRLSADDTRRHVNIYVHDQFHTQLG